MKQIEPALDAYTKGMGYAENKVDAELIHRLGRLQGRRASTVKTSVNTLKEALRLLHRHGEDDGYDGNHGKAREREKKEREERDSLTRRVFSVKSVEWWYEITLSDFLTRTHTHTYTRTHVHTHMVVSLARLSLHNPSLRRHDKYVRLRIST